MYTIHIHYPCFEGYMDMEIWHTIEMPFVPRIGDDINIGHEKYSHLERKIDGDNILGRNIKGGCMQVAGVALMMP